MANFIACRIGVYAGADNPYELLAQAGVAGAEVNPRPDMDYEAEAKKAEAAGVKISSFSTGIVLGDPDNLEAFKRVIDGASSVGTKIIFISVKGGDEDQSVLFDRFRSIGDYAQERGVTLSVETHEPYGHNGDVAVQTMQALNHPAIGMNFDTANIYYYNENVDTVEELKKEIEYVRSVHLKDTFGGYHDSNFPVLGEGIVDFPEVFRLLGERGFTGPYTMELEGPLTAGKSLEERHAAVVACMDYLKSIGAC